MVATGASALSLDPASVAVASTGVIGQQLDREKVTDGHQQARRAAFAGRRRCDFADAIITTDRWPKRASLELELPGRHGARSAARQRAEG